MVQKRGVALSKTFAFQDARVYSSDPWLGRGQQHKVDSVRIDLIFYVFIFLNVVDLSGKWESLTFMQIFWDKGLLNHFHNF